MMERRTDCWCGGGERKGGRGKKTGRIGCIVGRKERKKEDDEDDKEKNNYERKRKRERKK